jgi:hypothetical protein
MQARLSEQHTYVAANVTTSMVDETVYVHVFIVLVIVCMHCCTRCLLTVHNIQYV